MGGDYLGPSADLETSGPCPLKIGHRPETGRSFPGGLILSLDQEQEWASLGLGPYPTFEPLMEPEIGAGPEARPRAAPLNPERINNYY